MTTYLKTYINGDCSNTHTAKVDPNDHQRVADTAAELLRVMQGMFADDVAVTVHAEFNGPALCRYTRNLATGTVTGNTL